MKNKEVDVGEYLDDADLCQLPRTTDLYLRAVTLRVAERLT